MNSRSRTDESASISSPEFVWSEAGWSESHGYLIAPVLEALHQFSAKEVLDLGCGNGAASGFLASKGFVMHGCDASLSGIELARSAFPGVDFFQHDLCNALPAECHGKYDAVVSLEVIEHLLLPRSLMKSAHEALRPGGILIVSTPYHGYLKNLALALAGKFDDHWHPLRDFGHVKFFSKKTLLQLVSESGFEVLNWRTAGRVRAFACSMIAVARKREAGAETAQ